MRNLSYLSLSGGWPSKETGQNQKDKQKSKKKKATTYKLRFTPKEYKTTPQTPRSHPTDTTTVIQNTQPVPEQVTSTTTTHYN